MTAISLPKNAWLIGQELRLYLPDSWYVKTCRMEGDQRPAMSIKEIREALGHTIGCPQLTTLATGKKEAVIVFDSLTAVSGLSRIIPSVLESLNMAGIADNHIRFIFAAGLQEAAPHRFFLNTLGEEIIRRFPILIHNPLEGSEYVGNTNTLQTPVSLNAEYLHSDLRILISLCAPEGKMGFGGGSRLILPGIASFETIKNHYSAGSLQTEAPGTCLAAVPAGKTAGIPDVFDLELYKQNQDEAAAMAGIGFSINIITSPGRGPVAIYCGEWRQSYSEALKDAFNHYRTPGTGGYDLVIANCFTRASRPVIGLDSAIPLVCPCGGEIVIIAGIPAEKLFKYRPGGSGQTERHLFDPIPLIPEYINQVIVYNEYSQPGDNRLLPDDRVKVCNRWSDILARLEKSQGTDASVAVIPDATIQYFDRNLQPAG